ncbi:MAG TPA: hypothetical protein VIN08_21480 [Ohtaekwangia sp.]|uniref:hypothetical protein n=1 Tax=Ohtaekwangia sp. TaxID=2066019 RepID=UPI002F952F44
MKRSAYLLAVTLAACTIGCKHKHRIKIPEAARRTLHALYPAITKSTWKVEDDGNYEATFHYQGKETSIVLSAEGTLLEKEMEILQTSLPAPIKEAIQKDYNGYGIEEAAVLETNGIVRYEAEVSKDDETFDLIFNADGNLYKKIRKEEDSD